MKMNDYLSQEHVSLFVAWLSNILKQTTKFEHVYVVRKTGKLYKFTSVYDAYVKYVWNNNDFKQNNSVLLGFKKKLGGALSNSSETEALEAVLNIFKWGGVINGNTDWALDKAKTKILCKTINSAGQILGDPTLDLASESLKSIKMNAGMTKIYSLVQKGFIIYDSRVGAALGLLVRKFCEEKKLEEVPESLCFSWGKPKESKTASKPKNRNPSKGQYRFPEQSATTESGQLNWLRDSIKASWLLNFVLEKNNDLEFNRVEDPLRAVEAALFMIGYDIPLDGGSQSNAGTLPTSSKTPVLSENILRDKNIENLSGDNGFRNSSTLSGDDFCWKITRENSIVILRRFSTGLKENVFTENQVNLLSAHVNAFDLPGSPLANNVQKMSNGSEVDGIGSFLYSIKPDTSFAQAGGNIAALMVHSGYWQETTGSGRGWRFMLVDRKNLDWATALRRFWDICGTCHIH